MNTLRHIPPRVWLLLMAVVLALATLAPVAVLAAKI
jgi:hypothetical protein